jgi:hypothetical protein
VSKSRPALAAPRWSAAISAAPVFSGTACMRNALWPG